MKAKKDTIEKINEIKNEAKVAVVTKKTTNRRRTPAKKKEAPKESNVIVLDPKTRGDITPQKLILKSFLSPGDIVTMTVAVRDLKKAHGDKYLIDVRTSCGAIWEGNPYITKIDDKEDGVREIKLDYPLIHRSNTAPFHFVHGYLQHLEEQLKVKIPITDFKGDIHIRNEEKMWISQLAEMGINDKFWIINAGGKFDFTAKWVDPDKYQKVVDHFKGKITFVQVGEKGHFHVPIKGAINLVGKTDFRQLIRLIYHSSGVLTPVTATMHLAAAIEMKNSPPINRPCVVIAGGREPSQWEAYPNHQYLHTNGALPCCDNGGCWKSRATLVGDGDKKDKEDLCIYPISIKPKTIETSDFSDIDFREAKCLNIISAEKIIEAIELYYDGGVLEYGSCIPDNIPEKAKEFLVL